jgi:undecaprenyl-diphosphatase
MNVLEYGCAVLTFSYLKAFMNFVGYPGKGTVALLIGAAILAGGYLRGNTTVKRLGWAIMISLAAVAALTITLKLSFQLPRPTARVDFGFPSGDTATAFSLAAAIGTAYPSVAPLTFIVASLTAIARLHSRAHFVWDIIAGAILGSACGYFSARKLIAERQWPRLSYRQLVGWGLCAAIFSTTLWFFWSLEKEIARHNLTDQSTPTSGQPLAMVEFGTPSARQHLRNGWTTARSLSPEGIPVNWVDGLAASLVIPLTNANDARLLMRLYPYRPQGFLCQRAEIKINGAFLTQVWLEQGWQYYQIKVPKNLFRAGDNQIDFAFAYHDNSNWHGMNPERKYLSVAFNFLSVFPEHVR